MDEIARLDDRPPGTEQADDEDNEEDAEKDSPSGSTKAVPPGPPPGAPPGLPPGLPPGTGLSLLVYKTCVCLLQFFTSCHI